jgi:hypothetical protein
MMRALGRQASRGLRTATILAAWLAAVTLLSAAQEGAPPLTGEVASLTLDRGDAAAPGGTIVVNGVRVVIPSGLNLDLPAAESTLAWLFQEAQARCRARGESGLAKADTCRVETAGDEAGAHGGLVSSARDGDVRERPPAPRVVTEIPPAVATIEVVRAEDGRLVAENIRLTRSLEQLMGGVTFVNPDEGYIRINGYYRQDEGGTMIRVNDPFHQHGEQHGAACGDGANCSPDKRLRVGSSAWTVRFERGNPACIGGAAQGCYAEDRKVAAGDVSSRIPILVGDNVTVEGAFHVADGVRYFSAQTLTVQATLSGDRQQ